MRVRSSVADEPGGETQWRRLDSGWVRALWFRPSSPMATSPPCVPPAGSAQRGVVRPGPPVSVVIFPGLGLPRYTLPLARALAKEGVTCVVFDALAFRRRGDRVLPSVEALAAAGAEWLMLQELPGPVTLLGHSTGAQVALEVALTTQGERSDLRLVMGGPTFTPTQRRWRRLVPAALTAYRKDTPKELVVLRNLLHVRTDVGRIVWSGLGHRPEERVQELTVPLCLTAGESDSFAPEGWLRELASRAGGPSEVHVLGGSHNNVFTHADDVVSLLLGRG